MKQAEIISKVRAIRNSLPSSVVVYRQANPIVTLNDFYMASCATFKQVAMTRDEFMALPGEFHRSDSGSCYKVVGELVYRMSDHWGRVASCWWWIELLPGRWMDERDTVGVAHISEFTPNYDSARYLSYNESYTAPAIKAIEALEALKPFAKMKAMAEIEEAISFISSQLPKQTMAMVA